MTDPQTRWSQRSPQQLLDEAQRLADGPGNHMTQEKTMAHLLVQAALVQAIENVAWTLEHRIAPSIGRTP